MKILGIDPGYGRLGYAVLEKNKSEENLIDYSCVETSPKQKHEERILKIAEKVEEMIKKHKPDILCLEKLFITKNQKTAMAVAEVRGILIFLGTKNGIKIQEYTPLQVKAAVCGNGKASKDQVEKMVKLLIKIRRPVKYDDTYDAIALCLTASATIKI
ncbi:MAG: crossover junction endodeoxyribonuclease RuvC [Candidatus Pacebacteria bacterium]|nr:crossover junction endodeoxyribonuclease RuvC [Candidatus Paceibacterota bacterium]